MFIPLLNGSDVNNYNIKILFIVNNYLVVKMGSYVTIGMIEVNCFKNPIGFYCCMYKVYT